MYVSNIDLIKLIIFIMKLLDLLLIQFIGMVVQMLQLVSPVTRLLLGGAKEERNRKLLLCSDQ